MNLARQLLFWGLLGGLVALPLDALHVVTGVLSYKDPVLGLQDWFAVPLFVGAGIALGLGHRHIATRLARVPAMPATTWGAALFGLAALVFAYASSGFLQRWPVLALVVYAALFAIAVTRVHAAARGALVLHGLGAALVGPLVEISIASTGAFSYHHPDVLGVALWLPGIYLNAGTASHLLDRVLLARHAA